ncbi:CobQ/CobB/MinD/ParA nucleotide binding domain protein [Pelotomaculum schinkii]|uniref:CobQ/CobB/MinD/ParA nucleotide binding domain protein n=1 Tax=Pelotomaculum schinkii TaxID=78350 RepID=A0A4Y7R6Y1_9FIRM|nr:hypothetical protein [Pelotomaculum schinkii]TEB04695.1 CobQ/CobB/MinD/ParA nucleotide binding domain protein [Pelotomaculum schinkii]
MLFFSNNAQKLHTLGFRTTENSGEADAAAFFGKDSYEEAVAIASEKKICFIMDAESELGFFNVARLAFLGIIVLRDIAALKAVVEFIGEKQAVDAPGNEKNGHEEQSDIVAALFKTTGNGEEPCPSAHTQPGELGQVPGELAKEIDELPEVETLEKPPELPKPGMTDVVECPQGKTDEKKVLNSPPHPVAGPKRLDVTASPNVVFNNILASYSPSTSVGKTFLAVNAAAWLAGRGVKVALIDLDPDKADLWHTSYMDTYGPPRVTVSNWADVVGDPVQHVSQHPNLPNLFVLPGTTLVGGPLPDAAVVEKILRVLASRFDVVVADLNALLRLTHIVAALRMAGKIFLLSDLSEKSVSQTSMIFSQASELAGRDRMSMVVNMVKRGQLYRPRDIAKIFGFAEFSEIPDDPKTVMSCLKSRRFPVNTVSPVGNALTKCFEKELSGFAETPGELKPSRWKGLAGLRRR